jgi:hypothetical protein
MLITTHYVGCAGNGAATHSLMVIFITRRIRRTGGDRGWSRSRSPDRRSRHVEKEDRKSRHTKRSRSRSPHRSRSHKYHDDTRDKGKDNRNVRHLLSYSNIVLILLQDRDKYHEPSESRGRIRSRDVVRYSLVFLLSCF